MKFLRLLPAFLALSLARADIVIMQKIEGSGQTREMTIKLHGDQMRIDMPPQISVIRDAKTGDSITLMHTQKTYMRMTGAAMEALQRQMAKHMSDTDVEPGAGAGLAATGRKEKISGFDTEEYIGHIGAMSVRYWIAKNFPNWNAILRQMLKLQENGLDQMMKGHAPSATDFPGMPIRTEADLGGQKLMTTVLSAKEESINAAEFQLPPGYTETPAPAFDSRNSAISE